MLQSCHHNPKWPPKWPPKWRLNDLTFNVDGLENPLIPLCVGLSRAAKPFLKIGVAIQSPESKMAAKMATKMKNIVQTFSMQYAQLPVDILLDHTSCIVQWSDSYCWTSLVLHPGMMHTLMSFLGCIEKLMKASCVDMLLIVAFGGVAGIITGKWTNALQYCSRQSESTHLRSSGWTA